MTMLPASERRPLDAYYTPDALAVALLRIVATRLPERAWVWEPHAGGGAFVRAAEARGWRAYATDIDPACGWRVRDARSGPPPGIGLDAVIGNPPYRGWEAHAEVALRAAPVVGFLLRLAALEGSARASWWREHRPAEVHVLSERPSFTADGRSDSAAYAWIIWAERHVGSATLGWVPKWR